MKRSLFILLAFLSLNSFAQNISFIEDPAESPREHPVDMIKLAMDIDFKPKEGKVHGVVVHTFSPLVDIDTLFLDGPGIIIKQAIMDAEDLDFSTNKEGIIFKFKKPLKAKELYKLELEYEAFPKKGLYFIGWNDESNRSRKQIWTQGQGIDNRHWIPHFDSQNDKITTNIAIRFPQEYQVLSNGVLKSKKKDKSGNYVWNYVMDQPHASYLIMLGIGKYEIKTLESESGKKLNLWYYPDHANRVEATYRYSKEMFDFFEKEIGVPYQWPAYSQIPVQDFMYGAMENTSATLFGDFFMVDERGYFDRNYVGVNAHELAHQWFGDLVTARSAKHHWLQESFATYYNMLYEREAFGQDHYEWGLRNATKSALNASKKDLKPIANSTAGSTRHYPKGAHVLHMLKYVVGKEEYNRSVKRYLNRHKFENVDSEDLLIAFHDELGLSLNWFWKQWVYQGGEPKFDVNFKSYTQNNRSLAEFTVEQVHQTSEVNGIIKMPVVFEIALDNGEKITETRWVQDKFHRFEFEIPSDRVVSYALFDKGSNILKSFEFEKETEMLIEQFKRADHMIDRYDALLGMRAIEADEKRSLLQEQFKKERFHGIKSEILSQLKADSKSQGLFKMALSDKDARVRRTAISVRENLEEELRADAEKMLKDSSYVNIEKALAVLCERFPDRVDQYLEMTKNETGIKGNNIRIKWLEIAVSSGKDEYLKELLDYSSNAFEFLTRVAAVQSLEKLDYFDEALFHNLASAIGSSNSRLAGPCGKVLKSFNKKLEWKSKILDWHKAHDYQFDWQKEKVAKMIKS